MSDIRLVKLRSGEELIGDVTVINDEVVISNPCQIMPTEQGLGCLLYTSPSPRDRTRSRMPSSA